MSPDVAICERCTLPDCDIMHAACRLKRVNTEVFRLKQDRAPDRLEAARAWKNEYWIDWKAKKSEAHHG